MSWEAPPGEENFRPWPPVEAGAAPRKSRRRLIWLIAAAIGTSVVLTMFCGGAVILSMRAADGDLTHDPPVAAPTFELPKASPFGGHYNVPSNLCISTDYTRLRPLFTVASQTPTSDTSAGAAVRGCKGDAGNDAVSGQFRLVATYYADVDAAANALVAVAKGGPPLAVDMVPELGDQAFAYRDTVLGRTVIAREANLVLAMSWHNAARPPVEPDGLDQALTEVCRVNLRLLQFV